MPTFARLIGAVLLAALGGFAAYLASGHLEDGVQPGMLIPGAAGLGAVIGWVFTGRHLERGGKAVAVGIGSVALLVFWTSFLFALEEMISRSMRNTYRGSPTEAVQDVFNIMLEHTELMQTDVLIALGVGAVVVGVLTGLVGRYLR